MRIKKWFEYSLGILASRQDEAALTQANLLENQNYTIHYLNKSSLFLNSLDLPSNKDAWIVLSKHSSKADRPSLTVHSVGNFGPKAEFGGEPSCLGCSFAPLQSLLLSELAVYQSTYFEFFKNFSIVCEATHHGPTIPIPVTFIEMGSTIEIWKSIEVAKAIVYAVTTILDLDFRTKLNIPTAIAFGGNHYPEKFSAAMIDQLYFIGHILPKYAAEHINSEIIDQMINRTIPEPQIALIDKKGIRKKAELKFLLQKKDLEIIEL
jgi:D-aminoacyl-tRNA deacylase